MAFSQNVRSGRITRGFARARQTLGRLAAAQGALDEAAAQFRQAIDLFGKIGDTSQISTTLQFLGNALQFRGDYREAIATSKRSLEIRSPADDYLNPSALRLIGNAYGELGDHWQELDYHIRSVEGFEKVNLQTAGAGLGSIGAAYFALGDYDKAESYFKQSLASAEKYDDITERERNLANLGELHLATRNYRRAREHLEKALSIADSVGNVRFKAGILIALGEAYQRGPTPDYPRAIGNSRRGVALARTLGIKALLANGLNTLGDNFFASADLRGFESAFREALELGEASELQDVIWLAQAGLGKVLVRKGELGPAFNQFGSAIRTLETIRGEIPSPDIRVKFLEDKLEVYENMLDVLFRRHQLDPKVGYDRLAFQYAEQSRARAFLDVLTEAHADVRKGLTGEQAIRHATLMREYSRTASALLQADSVAARAAASKADENLKLFLAEVRSTNPAYAELVAPPPFSAADAQTEARSQHTVIVAYSLGRRRSLGWIVSPSRFAMLAFSPRSVIEDKVRKYRGLIATQPHNERDLTAYSGMAQDLWRELLGQIDRHLGANCNLAIVPDGILNYLPFETLMRPPSSEVHKQSAWPTTAV